MNKRKRKYCFLSPDGEHHEEGNKVTVGATAVCVHCGRVIIWGGERMILWRKSLRDLFP